MCIISEEEVSEGAEHCSDKDRWLLPKWFRTVEDHNQGWSYVFEERWGLLMVAYWLFGNKTLKYLKLVSEVGWELKVCLGAQTASQ